MTYEDPSVTVDLVIFSVEEIKPKSKRKHPDRKLKILLGKREKEPFKNEWALTGTFLRIDEEIDDTAKRVLKEKLNIDKIYMEQLYTWGGINRDPRKRILSISYLALSDKDEIKPEENKEHFSELNWFLIEDLDNIEIAFDHREIINYALERIKNKAEYTDIVLHLMPEYFTLTELQKTYESVLEKEFTIHNFRRKTEKLLEGKMMETEEYKQGGMYNKAKLYKKI